MMRSPGTAGWITITALGIAWGCARVPERIYPPKMDAQAAAAKALERYDTNQDGRIAGAELESCPALQAAMARIDLAPDGTITAEKIAARIKAWQATKVGRLPAFCTVRQHGRPLADADVRLVPEPFLGDKVPAGSGKTDENGQAWISVSGLAPGDPAGIAPGFYRVEITKAGQPIPAKYNSATILGLEAAPDVSDTFTFDLNDD